MIDIYVTTREVDVWRGIALGKTTKQIAGELGIHAKTADHHRSRLYPKIRAKCAADATRAAVMYGIIAIEYQGEIHISAPQKWHGGKKPRRLSDPAPARAV